VCFYSSSLGFYGAPLSARRGGHGTLFTSFNAAQWA